MKSFLSHIHFKYNTKVLSLIVIGVLILLCILINIFSGRVNPEYTISRIFINQERFDSLTKYNLTTTTPLTTEIFIDDEKLIYDAVDNRFYYSHVDGTDFGKKTLSIKNANYSQKSALLGNYIHASILNSDSPKLILYNNNEISVSDFVVTTLPVINIIISA